VDAAPGRLHVQPGDQRAELTDFGAVMTNSTTLITFPHTITAAFLTAGAFMLGVSAWHLLRKRDHDVFRPSARLAMWVMLISGALVAITGDIQARVMTEQQPMKMAAAEAMYNTSESASFSIFTVGTLDGRSEVWGVPLDANHHFVGSFFDLLNPYALLAGLTTFALFTTHGAVFLALKTAGEVRDAARRLAARVGTVTVVLAAAFLGWTQAAYGSGVTWLTAAVAAVALVAALVLNGRGREGWSFAATAVTIVAAVATLFINLYPSVFPSTLDPAYSLNVTNAASTPYTLKVMTWVAVIFTPIVLMYQGWTYWVFRKRISVADIPAQTGLPPRRPAADAVATASPSASPET
jgi:cytochrome bd-type quinol oxidase subunit 2